MRKRTAIIFLVSIVAAVYLSLSPGIWAEEKFEARLLMQSGPKAGVATKFEITIESYTTDEEVSRLKEVFYKEGYESFMNVFRGMNKGIFKPVGGHGVKIVIHVAHSIPTDKGRKIMLFTPRQSWDVGALQRVDPRFPFMVIELDIKDKGDGKGRIYEQASIELTEQGTVGMESYFSPPLALWGVKELKK
jgi:hypothetical protein